VAAGPPPAQDVRTTALPNTDGMDRILVTTGIVVAIIGTGAAGCSALDGGTPASGTSTGTSPNAGAGGTPGAGRSASAALYHQAAECIRAHGVPGFPDPTQNPQTGEWDLPPGTRKPPRSTMNACRSILSRIPETRGEPSRRPLTAAEMTKAKQFGQCMRRHGLADWPDPSPNGEFVLPQRYARLGKSGIRAQLMACREYRVEGTGMVIPEPR
jgi:hypothetical protein